MGTRLSIAFRCLPSKYLLLLLAVVLCSSVASAQAPSTIFQLNGDPANDTLTCTYGPCDYFNQINLTGTSGTGRGHSALNTFINGTSSTPNFTGGGSKDANLISQWNYTIGSTPNKDTLNAGYAAAYNITDFDVIFGADRLSPNGDANIGIWFFQQNVTLNGTGGFNGAHENGDVFVISAFTGGGGTSGIQAFSWNQVGLPNAINGGCASGVKNPSPGQCAATNLLLLANPSTVCTSTSSYCAITNSSTVSASWASYSGGTLASPLFFEGGVDITQAFAAVGGTVPCFASFLEETRSSQSVTAVLKDFLLGSFPVCSMTITKACGVASPNANGTAFTYPVSGTVVNSGIGTISNVQVKDCVGGSFAADGTCSGTLNTINVTPSTLTGGATGTWSDSSTSTATTQSDQAIAVGSAAGAPLQSTNTASASCSASANSTLNISKSCSTTLQQAANGTTVAVVVSYGGQVCNTGPSQITGVSIKDYPDSVAIGQVGTGSSVVDSGITLGPAGSVTACATYGPHTYTPTVIDETISGGNGAGRYFFDDLVTIPTATPTIGTLTKVTSSDTRTNGTFGFGTARCPICQGSAECTTTP